MRRALLIIALLALFAAATCYWWQPANHFHRPATLQSQSQVPVNAVREEPAVSALETVDALPLSSAPSSDVTVPPAVPDGQAALNESDFQKLRTLNHFSRDGVQRIAKALEPLRRWAQTDPAGAARWIGENLQGEGRARALEEVFAIWGQSSPREALAWLGLAGSAEGFRSAYAAAFAGFAYTDPAGAADWLSGAGNRAPSDGWSVLFSAWGQRDPDAAVNWAVANLTDDVRTSLLPELLASLRTPNATSQLLTNLASSTSNDVLARAARLAAPSDPAFALHLASQITDGTRNSVQAEIRDGRAKNAPSREVVDAAPAAVVSEPPVTGTVRLERLGNSSPSP